MLPFHTFLLIILLAGACFSYEPPVIKTHVIEGTPVHLVYPPARQWRPPTQHDGPCGSFDVPATRTEFPLDNGLLALEVLRNVSTARFSVAAHTNEPNSKNTSYTDLWPATELIGGTHRCFNAPGMDPRMFGLNGTIRLKYKRADDPYYSYTCADVTWIHYGDWIKPPHIECSSGIHLEIPALMSVAYMIALAIWVFF